MLLVELREEIPDMSSFRASLNLEWELGIGMGLLEGGEVATEKDDDEEEWGGDDVAEMEAA
jgi:hypothetical protein